MKGKTTVTRREFLTRSSFVAGSLLLFACGSNPSASSSSKSPAQASGQSGSSSTTLTFWNESKGKDLETFCSAGSAFEKTQAGHGVKSTCRGYDQLDKILTAIAAGDPPDLVQSSEPAGVQGIHDKGGLIPLNHYIQESKLDTSVILPGALNGCRAYDGTYIALPFMCYSTSDFFWNKALFEKKGLDPDKPPQTLEELMTMGEKFDEYQNGRLVKMGFHPSTVPDEIWVYAFGGRLWDPDKKKLTLHDPGIVKGLNWLVSYADKYGANNLDRLQASFGLYESANNPFLNGTIAMTGFWDALPAYRDRYAPNVKMGFSPFPHPASMPQQKGFGEVKFNPTFIPKGAKDPDKAWELLKFITTDIGTNIRVAKELANTPQNVKAINSPKNDVPPILKEIQRYAASKQMVTFPPSMPVASAFSDEWGRQTDLIFHKKVGVEAGLQAIQDKIQPQIDQALKG